MTNEQKLASDFISSFGITDITAKSLKDALRVQGFTVIEYSHISNSKNVETLLTSLGLKSYSMSFDAFTYVDKNMRLVFILENLSEHEQLILLAHEQGHICCNNTLSTTIRGQDILYENQANEFAHYLLKMSKHKGLIGSFIRNPKLSTVFLCLTILFALVVTVSVSISTALRHERQNQQQKYKILDIIEQTQIPSVESAQSLENDTVKTSDLDDISSDYSNTYSTDGLFTQEKSESVSDNYIGNSDSDEVSSNSLQTTSGNFYVTKSGTKYHISTCSYIQGKTDLKVITAQSIHSYEYTPCSKCIK